MVDFHSPAWLRKERKLLKRLRRGDRGALGELYQVMAPALYRRVISSRVQTGELAEDVLADTFVTAVERLDDFEERGKSIFAWLARIAVNKAMDVHRRRARKLRATDRLKQEEQGLPRAEPDAVERLSAAEGQAGDRERLDQALGELKPRYRKAVELRFLEDRSREDCARLLEIKVGTFDVLMHRALAALRKAWDAEEE